MLYINFVYNELPYISDVIKYYKSQGLEIYIIDNMSTDGTYEWLIENNIECSRFNTNESFDLSLLQKELERILHIKKPDWFVYAGADLYYVFDKTVNETLKEADNLGFNQVRAACYGALNTGENFKTPLYKNYFYGRFYKDLIMISKYHPELKMNGDDIYTPNANAIKLPGIMVNYGACKPIEEQKEKLQRRQKAWDNGLSRQTGKHFKSGSLVNWTWEKEDYLNFHRCPDKFYFKKLYAEN